MHGHSRIASSVLTDQKLEASGRLQPDCASRFVESQAKTRGAVLLLHGFTAGPWQFEELEQLLAQAGFHCYAPRNPGHGFQNNGIEDSSLLPNSASYKAYGAFVRQAAAALFELSQSQRVPAYLVGFSAGGTLALDLLCQHPDIARAVVIAPLLIPGDVRAQLVWSLTPADPLGLLGSYLDRVALGWPQNEYEAAFERGRRGHWKFSAGQLFALFHYAREVHRALRPFATPTRFVINQNDRTCSRGAIAAAYWRCGGPSRHTLVRIPRYFGAPHAFLSPREFASPARATLLQGIVRYLTQDET